MAKASIKNMMFYGFHGVYEYEREQGQKFYIDVEVETKDDKVVETDRIEDGVDMAAIYETVKDVTENQRFTMLAALGGPSATACSRNTRISPRSRRRFASRTCRSPARSTTSRRR